MPALSAKKSPVSLGSVIGEKCHRYYIWNKEQAYEGDFFRETLHGEGTYKWKDLAVYEGGFYSNYKEGYAIMSFPDNSCFEGLFVRNERFGPGVFTYSNGRQDVGFWSGRKLVRLSRTVDYIVPRLAPTSAAKIKLLQFRRIIPIIEQPIDTVSQILNLCKCCPNFLSSPYSRVINDPKSYFFEKSAFEKMYFLNSKQTREDTSTDSDHRIFWNEELGEKNETSPDVSPVPSHCLCPDKEFFMNYQSSESVDICERQNEGETEMGILAYFRQYGLNKEPEEADETPQVREEMQETTKVTKILAWNRSELCIRMLHEIFRYRMFEEKLSFNIAKLMLGERNEFRKTGEKEKECVEFLRTCASGPANLLRAMLCNYDISEELTDARGNNSVMFAAAADQHEIIDALLDYGADVNSFNDENLTPLNLCLLRRLAVAFNLGNWERAFLPREIQKNLDDEYEEIEWRKRISIPSLDRIFGDGSSFYENKWQVSSELLQDSDSLLAKNLSPLSSRDLSLTDAGQSILQFGMRMTSALETRLSINPLRTISKNKQKLQRKREEYNKSVDTSRETAYFFELSPVEKHEMNVKSGDDKTSEREETDEEESEEDGSASEEVRNRIMEIDKTIEKLLRRGADPNISEVPKPSIHLGVYSKSPKIVNLLQLYGANPNSKLYPNEGLLTPLHLLVLLKPSSENVRICELLLKYGADPEETTLPGFIFYEGEHIFLDPTEGRTPLQLLCMRPDLEYADTENNMSKIALLLSGKCDRTRLYNGHSYLSLAMNFGNLKLLKSLLCSKLFDPNAVLGNERGTLLHFLVSNEFQKTTNFKHSTRIFEQIKKAGGDLNKELTYPERFKGNFLEFGYREIEREKEQRRYSSLEKSGRKAVRKSKTIENDYLPDHEKLLKYVGQKMNEEKKEEKISRIKEMKELGKVEIEQKSKEEVQKVRKGKENIEKENKYKEKVEREKNGKEDVGIEKKSKAEIERKSKVEIEKEKKSKEEVEKERKQKEEMEKERERREKEEREKLEEVRRRNKRDEAGTEAVEKEEKIEKKMENLTVEKKDYVSVEKKEKENLTIEKREMEKLTIEKKIQEREAAKVEKYEWGKEKGDAKEKKSKKKTEKTEKEDKKMPEKIPIKKMFAIASDVVIIGEKKKTEKKKKSDENDVGKARSETEQGLRKSSVTVFWVKAEGPTLKRRKGGSASAEKTPERKNVKNRDGVKKEENQRKEELNVKSKTFLKSAGGKESSSLEIFPEKVRKSILNLLGNYSSLDVNKLFLPYVVLRDGDLYYGLKGKSSWGKEQYSLV